MKKWNFMHDEHRAKGLITSRLLLGTAGYPSLSCLRNCIEASGTQLVTVSLRRESRSNEQHSAFWQTLKDLPVSILPNTAGCSEIDEAVAIAQMSREVFKTRRIKLEITGDEWSLAPDPWKTLEAARVLTDLGFEVFPYMTTDVVLARRLFEAGCQVLMPWGSPIGSGQGVSDPRALERLCQAVPEATVIVDAGLGKASHAVQALECGADGVLLNTAVSRAASPVNMAAAFRHAVEAGLQSKSGGAVEPVDCARPSTPEAGRPFSHELF